MLDDNNKENIMENQEKQLESQNKPTNGES
jgi:hypothetical protein